MHSDTHGKPTRMLGTALDITGRKQAEEALRKSESRFRNALEVAPEGVLLVRSDGAIVFANEQAGRTFGYTPEELTGLHVNELVPGRFRIGLVLRQAAHQPAQSRRMQ